MDSPFFLIFSLITLLYAGWIASEGQASAHVPQSVQTSGSITKISPSEIASTGHSLMQDPQAMQSSVIM